MDTRRVDVEQGRGADGTSPEQSAHHDDDQEQRRCFRSQGSVTTQRVAEQETVGTRLFFSGDGCRSDADGDAGDREGTHEVEHGAIGHRSNAEIVGIDSHEGEDAGREVVVEADVDVLVGPKPEEHEKPETDRGDNATTEPIAGRLEKDVGEHQEAASSLESSPLTSSLASARGV